MPGIGRGLSYRVAPPDYASTLGVAGRVRVKSIFGSLGIDSARPSLYSGRPRPSPLLLVPQSYSYSNSSSNSLSFPPWITHRSLARNGGDSRPSVPISQPCRRAPESQATLRNEAVRLHPLPSSRRRDQFSASRCSCASVIGCYLPAVPFFAFRDLSTHCRLHK
jgi:hypothetical protein